jgi:hypothetical protein
MAAIVVIGIIILLVLFLISQVNVNIKEKDFEVMIIASSIAVLAFVWATMRKDRLVMEGV